MKRVLALHGVNLNMFGKRDATHYGMITLEKISQRLYALVTELGVEPETYQTNFEGEICEKIHKARLDKVDAIVINAGAWTHGSPFCRTPSKRAAVGLGDTPRLVVSLGSNTLQSRSPPHSVRWGPCGE
jgi:3-dehydroquinate dehydratase